MKTSVVITTYNGMNYIDEQLDSIRMQSVKVDEVIISDDVSNDGTPNHIRTYIKQYGLNNWRLIEREQNVGWKRNFYETTKEAHGDIILLADQDDCWLPNKVESVINEFNKNDKINLLVSNYDLFYSVVEKTQQSFDRQVSMMGNSGNTVLWKLTEQFHITDRPGCVYAIRKSFLNQVMDFYPEDHPFDSFLWLCAISSKGLYLIDRPLIRYRRHDNNAMHKKTVSNIQLTQRLNYCKAELRIIIKLKKYGLLDELTEKEMLIISKFYSMTKMRVKLFEEKRILLWPYIAIKYGAFYSSIKSRIADLIVCLK